MNHKKLVTALKQIEKLVANCLDAVRETSTPSEVATANEVPAAKSTDARKDIVFTLPFRPFINKYARGMSGPEKFTLVLARITKGNGRLEVTIEDLAKTWNGMKGTLGKFNVAYTTRAKDKAWVDSPKRGVYVLLPDWTEILGAN